MEPDLSHYITSEASSSQLSQDTFATIIRQGLTGRSSLGRCLMQSAEEKKEAEKASAAASRFAYNQLAEDEQVSKAPSAKRGKDGHLTLGAADDFWSNPTGSMKSTRSK